MDIISERTKMALDYRKSQGKKAGGDVPYGFDADAEGFLTENKKEQRVINIINKRMGSVDNYSQIAAYLNRNKHKTKRGSIWYPQTVKDTIKAHIRIPSKHFNNAG